MAFGAAAGQVVAEYSSRALNDLLSNADEVAVLAAEWLDCKLNCSLSPSDRAARPW
jgi:hypothetical protein